MNFIFFLFKLISFGCALPFMYAIGIFCFGHQETKKLIIEIWESELWTI